jgi:hypothetical protein
MTLAPVLARLDADLDAALDRLMALLQDPLDLDRPGLQGRLRRGRRLAGDGSRQIGFAAEKRPTPGHPMVVAHGGDRRSAPVVLRPLRRAAGRPAGALGQPAVRTGGRRHAKGKVIRGRGTSDDKGQLMTFVEAMRAWVAEHGDLPCQITIFLEGEEESGSPSLVPFMKENAEELKADVAMICDTGLFESRVPAITTMLRGLVAEEVILKAASRDLHSGMYGGLARNPIHLLTRILADLHDETGRVTLDGFYDGVPELPDEIRAQWQGLGFDHAVPRRCRALGAGRRTGSHAARDDLVAPDGGGERDHRRLHRRRLQDRAAGGGARQGKLPAGRRPGPRGGACGLRETCGGAAASGRDGRVPARPRRAREPDADR